MTTSRGVVGERAQLARLFEQSPSFLAILSGPEHRIEFVNPSCRQLVGDRELIGRTFAEALGDAVEQGFLIPLDEAYRTGKPYSAKSTKYLARALPDGPAVERFVDFVFQPLVDAAGSVTGILVDGVDVTGRVLSDLALRKSETRLHELNDEFERRAFELAHERSRTWQVTPDLLGVLNARGYFEKTNPAWQQVLGWSEEHILSTSIFDMIHPDDLAHSRAGFEAMVQQGKPALRVENRYPRPDGQWRWISWICVPEGGRYYCSGRDITEEKADQARLAAAENALRQSQKMEAIGQLTGGLAHDFNNLLQVISGNLELISHLARGEAKIEHRVELARAAVARGAKLSIQLLAFGRRQTLEPKVVNIGRLVIGIEDLLRRALGGAVEIEIVISAGLWNTLVDPGQIEDALLNLALNARDAMDGSGKLTIEVDNASIDDAYARGNADVDPGQYVRLAVSDTGCGMPAEVVEHAFEPFFSTKPDGKGTGLGLSMVYGFVKQSGGHVKIYSELGLGTTVKIYLPRIKQHEDTLVTPEGTAVQTGSETILVAEDDPYVRATVVAMLTELGYRVLKASDAAGALTVIESGVPIDLLFTDVIMPGKLKSRELARKARACRPELAVLFTSGYTDNAIASNGRIDAGVELLNKPYTREELSRKIRHVLSKRSR